MQKRLLVLLFTLALTLVLWSSAYSSAAITVTLTASNTVPNSGQPVTLNAVIAGGTGPYTVNFLNVTNSIAPKSISMLGYGQWLGTDGYPTNDEQQSCIVASGYIYCIGGFSIQNGVDNAVYYAPITSTGELGAWLQTTPYPENVYASSCTESSSSVYCIGGINSSITDTNSVYYAQILGSAGLGAWLQTSAYPIGVDSTYGSGLDSESCVSNSNYIFCIGGENQSLTDFNNVYSAPVLGSGSLGQWSQTSSYPTNDLEQSCVVSYNNIYCIGGYTSQLGGSDDSVYYSTIVSPGTLGQWQATTAYPTNDAAQSCVLSSNSIYCIGGENTTSGIVYNSVYHAPILPAGSVGAWAATSPYRTNDIYQSCIASSNNIYCIGGLSDQAEGPDSSVYYAPVSQNGLANSPRYTFTANSPTPNNAFKYNVIVTDSLGAVANSITEKITVNPTGSTTTSTTSTTTSTSTSTTTVPTTTVKTTTTTTSTSTTTVPTTTTKTSSTTTSTSTSTSTTTVPTTTTKTSTTTTSTSTSTSTSTTTVPTTTTKTSSTTTSTSTSTSTTTAPTTSTTTSTSTSTSTTTAPTTSTTTSTSTSTSTTTSTTTAPTTTISSGGGGGSPGGGGGGGGGGGAGSGGASKPTILPISTGYVITGFAPLDSLNVNQCGMNLNFVLNFITPTYSGVTVDGKQYIINQGSPESILHNSTSDCYLLLLNTSYLPIRQSITVEAYYNQTNPYVISDSVYRINDTGTANVIVQQANASFSLYMLKSLETPDFTYAGLLVASPGKQKQPPAPKGYEPLRIINVSVYGIPQVYANITIIYDTPPNGIVPFRLSSGQDNWSAISVYTLNSTSGEVTVPEQNGTELLGLFTPYINQSVLAATASTSKPSTSIASSTLRSTTIAATPVKPISNGEQNGDIITLIAVVVAIAVLSAMLVYTLKIRNRTIWD